MPSYMKCRECGEAVNASNLNEDQAVAIIPGGYVVIGHYDGKNAIDEAQVVNPECQLRHLTCWVENGSTKTYAGA